jgi:hypothetical protein
MTADSKSMCCVTGAYGNSNWPPCNILAVKVTSINSVIGCSHGGVHGHGEGCSYHCHREEGVLGAICQEVA